VQDKKSSRVVAQLMKEGQPIWITNLFVNRPWTVLIIGYLILIAATVVAVVNDYFALTP